MSISPHTIVVRREGLLSAVVDDEIVIFNPDHDNYVGLDDIGRALWEMLEEPRKVAELCRTLAEQYDGSGSVIEGDVVGFLAELEAEGVVRVVE